MCFNGKTCMIEDGIGVCRCLFNCSTEQNKVSKTKEHSFQNLSYYEGMWIKWYYVSKFM